MHADPGLRFALPAGCRLVLHGLARGDRLRASRTIIAENSTQHVLAETVQSSKDGVWFFRGRGASLRLAGPRGEHDEQQQQRHEPFAGHGLIPSQDLWSSDARLPRSCFAAESLSACLERDGIIMRYRKKRFCRFSRLQGIRRLTRFAPLLSGVSCSAGSESAVPYANRNPLGRASPKMRSSSSRSRRPPRSTRWTKWAGAPVSESQRAASRRVGSGRSR